MTVNEAAARLDVDYDFVLRLLRRGKLKGKKVGRKWEVDAGSVSERLLAVAEHRAKQVNGRGS
jgi:excisionase family DNA binding protein